MVERKFEFSKNGTLKQPPKPKPEKRLKTPSEALRGLKSKSKSPQEKYDELPEEVVEVKEVVPPTIHEKYRKILNNAKSGYIHGLTYENAMEILRWMENKTGQKIPMNFSCNTCIFDLIKRFANME